jgi:hypothetical protein
LRPLVAMLASQVTPEAAWMAVATG